MEYIIASLVAIFIATLIVYKVANNLFGLGLRLKPLLLCAVCAMFISLVLPKIVVGFAGLPGTLAVLAIFAVVFAYFVARCDDESLQQQKTDGEAESACCLTAEPLIQPEMSEQMTTTQENKPIHSLETPVVETVLTEEVTVAKPEFEQSVQLEDSSVVEELSGDMKELEEFSQIPAEVLRQMPDETDGEDVLMQEPAEQSFVQEADESDALAVSPVFDADFLEEIITSSEEPMLEQQLTDSQKDVDDNQVSTAEFTESTVAEPEFEQSTQLEDTSVVEELSGEMKELEEFNQIPVEVSQQLPDETDGEDVLMQEPSEQSFVQEADESDALAVLPVIDADLEEIITSSEDSLQEHQIADSQITTEEFTESAVAEPEFEQSVQLEDVSVIEELSGEMKEFEEFSQTPAEVSQQMPDETDGEDVLMQEPSEQSFAQEADDLIMEGTKSTVERVQFVSEQLDDLIDFAFLSKESQDYDTAFHAFKKALTLYPASEAAPFMIVEIGNILKNKGNYDEAIKVFSEGRNLSQTKQDEMMEQEFISTIAYLRITKNMLLQNRLGSIPFSAIPPQVIEQINEEFREWRSVGKSN